jgi:hypothetical protein
MVALRKPHKSYIPKIIEKISSKAGIRFDFFSTSNTQKTKAFGEKLGIETVYFFLKLNLKFIFLGFQLLYFFK